MKGGVVRKKWAVVVHSPTSELYFHRLSRPKNQNKGRTKSKVFLPKQSKKEEYLFVWWSDVVNRQVVKVRKHLALFFCCTSQQHGFRPTFEFSSSFRYFLRRTTELLYSSNSPSLGEFTDQQSSPGVEKKQLEHKGKMVVAPLTLYVALWRYYPDHRKLLPCLSFHFRYSTGFSVCFIQQHINSREQTPTVQTLWYQRLLSIFVSEDE